MNIRHKYFLFQMITHYIGFKTKRKWNGWNTNKINKALYTANLLHHINNAKQTIAKQKIMPFIRQHPSIIFSNQPHYMTIQQ